MTANTVRNLIQAIIACLFFFSSANGLAQVENERATPPSFFLRELEAAIQDVEEQTKPLTIEGLLATLDYDADRILNFVTENIHFERYSGLLRGPSTTLMSRAGNDLDQAVLLAKMLKDAGYDARIVRGKLPESYLRQLLIESSKPRETQLATVSSHKLDALAEKYGLTSENGTSEESELSGAERDTHQTAETLSTLLSASVPEWSSASAKDEILNEFEGYFWVQYKTDAQTWLSAHPAFSNPQFRPKNPEAEQYVTDTVPNQLLHKIKFEFFIDQKYGDKEVTHSLMAAYERPAANLSNRLLTFQAFPSGMHLFQDPNRNDEDIDVIQGTELFYPIFNGVVPEDVKLFDLRGNILPAEATTPMAGIFSQFNEKLTTSIDALSGIGTSGKDTQESAVQLNRLWYKVVLTRPNGTQEIIKRVLADRDWFDTNNEFIASLTRSITFYVITGYIDQSLAIQNAADAARNGVHLFGALSEETKQDSEYVPDPEKIWLSFSEFTHSLYGFLSDRKTKQEQNSRIFHSEPNVVARYQAVIPGLPTKEAVDVLNNTKRALALRDGRVVIDREALVIQGVWETYLEAIAFFQEKKSELTTTKILGAQPELHTSTILLSAVQADEQLNWLPASVRELIKMELGNGFITVVPKIAQQDMYAWWRIHPKTGETLGMGYSDGQYGGVETTEELLMDEELARAYIAAMKGTGASIACTLAYATIVKYAGVGTRAAVGTFCAAIAVKLGIDAEWCLAVAEAASQVTTTAIKEQNKLRFMVKCIRRLSGLP